MAIVDDPVVARILQEEEERRRRRPLVVRPEVELPPPEERLRPIEEAQLETLQQIVEEIRKLRNWLVPSIPNIDFVDLETDGWKTFEKAADATMIEIRNSSSQDVEYSYEKSEAKVNVVPAGEARTIGAKPGNIHFRRTVSTSSPRVFIEWWNPGGE